MAFNATNPVTVGAATKKDHYDRVFDNTLLLKTSISDDGLTWSGRVVYNATVILSTPIMDVAQTWNAGAVTFTALKLNVTDTASAAASLLLDLQVGGASKFKVQKDGAGTFSGVVGVTAANGTGVSTALLTLTGLTTTNYHGFKTGNAWLLGRTSAGDSYFAANTDLFTATITGASSYYAQSSGAHTWNSAPSVSAGAAITPVILMTLTAAGFLGVGVTPSYRFHVRQDASAATTVFHNGHPTAPDGIYVVFDGGVPNNASAQFLYLGDSSAVRAMVKSNGGLHNYSANNVNLSDLDAKDISGRAPSQRSKIRQIAMYRGRYKDATRGHDDLMWGAQDILAIDPEWVDVWQEEVRDDNGAIVKPRLLGTRDHLIFLATVGVVAELVADVDDHETRIKRLEDKKAA